MHLIANIGTPKTENFHGREMITGLCKLPVDTPLALTKTGFSGGDGVQEKKHHRGTDKAAGSLSALRRETFQELLKNCDPAR